MIPKTAFPLLVVILSFAMQPIAAAARTDEGFKNKGLVLSPVREYMEVSAGRSRTGTFTVVNSSDQPLDISFSVESFSVADFSYDYRFRPVKNDWVRLAPQTVTLQPAKSQAVKYSVTVPDGASPGGHYYTLFASTTQRSGSFTNQVRAAMPLYLTVAGQLSRTAEITKGTFPSFSWSKSIPYSMDIKNTGNVHYFAHTEASLSGPFIRRFAETPNKLVYPDTMRAVSGTIQAPFLPGIYRARYGLVNDQGQHVTNTKLLFYAPPWSFVLLIFLVWGIVIIIKKLLHKRYLKQIASDK